MLNANVVKGMSDLEVNNAFLIKNTQYNRNSRYSDRVKRTWQKMYDYDGYTIKTIAMIWGCPSQTVKRVVDEDYRTRLSEARKVYNKTYADSHKDMRVKYNTSKKSLAEYKRSILSSSALAHLTSI